MQAELEAQDQAWPARCTVLVVDRYQPSRQSICSSIAELGYDVIAAATADDARATMARWVIDLIVADADDDAIRGMVEELRGHRTPIRAVMLTTLADHRAGVTAATPLLEKPMHLDALADAIASALAG